MKLKNFIKELQKFDGEKEIMFSGAYGSTDESDPEIYISTKDDYCRTGSVVIATSLCSG